MRHRSLLSLLFVLTVSCVTTPSQQPLVGGYDPDAALRRFDPDWKSKRKNLKAELELLKEKLFTAQKDGLDVSCARQITEEASAAIGTGADFRFARERIADLKLALHDTKPQTWAKLQSPDDGSWGACYKQWYWKLAESTEQIRNLDHQGKMPQYPAKFLDRINSPENLVAYLDSVLISDVEENGKIRRRELNEGGSALVKLITKGLPRNYPYHLKLQETLYNYLDRRWQNPETGYWGAWFREGNQIIKTDDLSITFHIISYRIKEPLHWDKIARTTLAIKDRMYPFGWRDAEGQMSNHHNYDVVRLLRLGWNHLADSDKEAAKAEFKKMLDWCLHKSLQPDGSFRYNASDDSLGDSYYFGVSLLSELGYFDKAQRFWTDDEFPEAEGVRLRIIESLRKIGGRDSMMKNALAKLDVRPAVKKRK